MRQFRNIITSASWMASEQVLRLLAALFISIWIARHLGPEGFGALNFAISLSAIISTFASLGFARIAVRDLSKHVGDLAFCQRQIDTMLAMRLIAGAGCFLIITGISITLHQGDPLLVALVASGIAFNAFDIIDQHFQAMSQVWRSVLARIVAFCFVSGIKIALLAADAGVAAFALMSAIEIIASAISMYVFYRGQGYRLRPWRADIAYGASLVRQSWPEIFGGFACIVFTRIDQVMLGNMLGAHAVGIYSVASRLAEAWYFIPWALVSSTFPHLVRLREIDTADYLKYLQKLMLALTVIAYCVAIFVQIFAGWGIRLLYGQAYAQSATVLTILIWNGVFVSLGVSSGSWIIAEGRLILNLTRNLLGAGANILFNIPLITKYGLVGAAYGTLFSQVLAYFLSDFINPETRKIGVLKFKALVQYWK